MAYDAQGHKLTTYRGETGYWGDEDESGEPFFIRAKAADSTAGPLSTAMQMVQALQASGIDPSNATVAQLEAARQAVAPAPQVSATSGGMAAPQPAPAQTDTREVVQADDGNYYRYSPETGLDMSQPVDPAALKAASIPQGLTRLGPVMNTPQGIVGDVYKDAAGKFYLDESTNPNNYGFGKTEATGFREIPWNAQQVEAELGARATAHAQQQADENPAGDSFMSFITSPGSMAVLAGFGAVLGAAGAFGAAAGGGGAAGAVEADVAMPLATEAASGGMSVAPWATGPSALETAEMAAGQFSIAPEYLAANTAPSSLLASAGAAAAGGVAADVVGSDWAAGAPTTEGVTTPGFDQIGSDWSAGTQTGNTGGLLETTPEGLTAANTAAASGVPGSVNSGIVDSALTTGSKLADKAILEVGKGIIKDALTDDPTTPTIPETPAPRPNEVGELSFSDVLLGYRPAQMLPGWNT